MHMPVCICRHIGLHTYACIRMYMRIPIFTHRSIYVYTQVYVLYTYMFIYYTHTHTHTHARAHTHIHYTCIYTDTHAHAHTHIHVHIHRVMEHVDRTRASRPWTSAHPRVCLKPYLRTTKTVLLKDH
jgi:hypothetical protein